jgi:hypothetical protein
MAGQVEQSANDFLHVWALSSRTKHVYIGLTVIIC